MHSAKRAEKFRINAPQNRNGNSAGHFEPQKSKEKSGKIKETHRNCCAETEHYKTPAKHGKVNKNQPIYTKKIASTTRSFLYARGTETDAVAHKLRRRLKPAPRARTGRKNAETRNKTARNWPKSRKNG
jgi:hypothetical protein